MDEHRFDAAVRAFAREGSRRTVLRGLLAGASCGVLSALGLGRALAACGAPGADCAAGAECCGGSCEGGHCCGTPGIACASPAECCGDGCVAGRCCKMPGAVCAAGAECCHGTCDANGRCCAAVEAACSSTSDCCDPGNNVCIAGVCRPPAGPPSGKEACKHGGWRTFTAPRVFKSQGDCVRFVQTGT